MPKPSEEVIIATDRMFEALCALRAESNRENLARVLAAAKIIEALGYRPSIIKGRSIQVVNTKYTWIVQEECRA